MASRKRYQDRAGSRGQSTAWGIEAKYVPRFQRVFVDAMRSLYTDPGTQAKLVRIANSSGSIEAVTSAVSDLIDSEKLAERFERVYVAALQDTGEAAFREAGIKEPFQAVAKAVEGIPTNRHSAKWINERTGELIRQVTAAERKRVRQILARNFGKRVNRKFIAQEIGATVGLLAAEEARVHALFESAVEEGLPAAAARIQSGKFAAILLLKRGARIARTETIMAQNQGKLDAWRVAGDEGLIPPGTLKTWVAASKSERTCKICGSPPEAPDGLDRQQVPVEESFFSEVTGEYYERPPAHPNCRCTMTLNFPEG